MSVCQVKDCHRPALWQICILIPERAVSNQHPKRQMEFRSGLLVCDACRLEDHNPADFFSGENRAMLEQVFFAFGMGNPDTSRAEWVFRSMLEDADAQGNLRLYPGPYLNGGRHNG